MFENVLIAVDGSEHSLKAAKLAGGIARNMGSDLWVVIAYDPVPGKNCLSRQREKSVP
jgi:nucleotide-binding universal stress UspA family protein